MLVAEIKKAILVALAARGSGYVDHTLPEEAVRAVAELIVEGAVREDESYPGCVTLVITRRGLEECKA